MTEKACRHPRNYVDPKEKLSRFIYEPSHIKNGVKQQAFRVDNDNTVSVYRTTDRKPEYIWNLCDAYTRQTKAVGRAEFYAKVVTDLDLSFDPDGKPHTRHVAIIGWDSDKDKHLVLRQELARKAISLMRPN